MWFPIKPATEESIPLWPLVRQNFSHLGTGIDDTSKKLGERRDGLLLGAGVLYALGYLTWALYGLNNGIGFIAVFDVQYFAAGIVPAILIGLFMVVIRLLRAVEGWLKYAPTRRQLVVATILTAFGTIAGPFFLLFLFVGTSTATWLTALSLCVSVYVAHLVARNRGSRFLQGFMIWSVRVYGVFGFILWLLYVDRVMPLVPTEWGGAKPRCIVCDIDNAQLSPETQSRILVKTDGDKNSKVVRTRPLNLIFDGSEYFFLTEQDGQPSAVLNPIYRLRKDAVKAVFACPKGTL